MRVYLAVILLAILGIQAQGQQIEKFYTYNWKPCEPSEARFYSFIKNTDSGWLRYDYYIHEKKVEKVGLYMDSSCKIGNGIFRYYHPNGVLQSKGKYSMGRKIGVWLSYHANGYISDSTTYDNGHPVYTTLRWHSNRFPSDSIVYNTEGIATAYSWFDDGSLAAAGRLDAMGKHIGKWQFFHRNGRLSALETYDHGRLADLQYYAEDGSLMNDTTGRVQTPPQFPGGIDHWKKFFENRLYFPSNYKIVNADKAVVIIDFTVDESGNVTDPTVAVSFDKVFDNIALSAIKRSPKWIPAVAHNRNVKFRHRQLVNFEQIQR